MKKMVLSILVDNTAGVLSRVSGLFSRRGYNIDSLTVGETQDPAYSRMTVVVNGDDLILDQIRKQLIKLEDAGGLTESATVVEGNGNVQTNVAGNPNAIGYVSFSYIDETVKSLKVNGVEGTPETAKSGEYSLSRPFLFVYMDDKASDLVKAFLDFTVSEDGQAFVEEHGGIKVN